MSVDSLKRLCPAKEPLIDLVFRRVDDAMLRDISEADYGMDAREHLKALVAIKSGNMPCLLTWKPKEVLELIRWSEPQDEGWQPGGAGERGHWMRLFSCAALVLAGAEPENVDYLNGEESTIIQLFDSALKLGTETALASLKFLAWRLQDTELSEWIRPHFAIAVLILAVAQNKSDPELTDFLKATTRSNAASINGLFVHCVNEEKWTTTIRRVFIEPRSSSDDLRSWAKLLINEPV